MTMLARNLLGGGRFSALLNSWSVDQSRKVSHRLAATARLAVAAFAFSAAGQAADAPALRSSGYINGKLNVVVASTEADYNSSQVEVQVYQNGEWQTVSATTTPDRMTFGAWGNLDLGNQSVWNGYSLVWCSPLAATGTVAARYRVTTGEETTDWSAEFEVTPSVAAASKVLSSAMTTAAGNDTDGDILTTASMPSSAAVVYDLGSVCEIAAIRFAPRIFLVSTLPTMKIEAANREDFADAQPLVEFGDYGDALTQLGVSHNDAWNVSATGWTVKTFELSQPVAARYFRVSRTAKTYTGGTQAAQWRDRDNGTTLQFADIEFSLAAGAIQAPVVSVGLNTASAVPYNDRVPVITYNAAEVEGATYTVERATSFGGPYAAIAAASATASASVRDESSQPGVLYYYRVKAENASGASYSDVVSYLRDRRLERDANNLTTLASGVQHIMIDNYVGGYTFWRGLMNTAFDGDLSTMPCTVSVETPGAWNYWPNPFVGVNLGTDCRLTGCSVIYGTDDAWYGKHIDHFGKYGNVKVYGTAFSAGPWNCGREYNVSANIPDVTGGMGRTELAAVGTDIKNKEWRYLPISDTGLYRSVYLQSGYATTGNGNYLWANGTWCGNVSEIGFFGYSEAERAAAYADIVTAPTETGAEMTGDGVRVTWSGAQNATGFRVDRREAGAELWRAVSGTLAAGAESFTDASVSSATYEYRVVALKGDADGGYAMPVTVVAYQLGNGTGLRADYVWPYLQTGYDASEAVVATSMTAAPEVDWADGAARIDGVADATANVRVVYRGKLIVPQDGYYGFRLSATDGAALRIDGASLVNQWDASAAARVSEATLTLTAGEHDIRLDTWQGAGARSMRLEWKMGDGVFGAIPLRQLKPAADAFSEAVAVRLANGNRTEMWTARSFGLKELGTAEAGADGALMIAGYGWNPSADTPGYNYVYRTIEGDFDFSCKVTLPPVAVNDRQPYFGLIARNGLGANEPVSGAGVVQDGWMNALCVIAFDQGAAGALSWNADKWWNYTWDNTNKRVKLSLPNPFYLRLTRVQTEAGVSVYQSFYKATANADWTEFNSWTDTDKTIARACVVGFAAARTAAAGHSTEDSVFKVEDVRLRELNRGMVIVVR